MAVNSDNSTDTDTAAAAKPASKGSLVIALGSLMIALLALVAVAWMALQQQPLQELPARVGADTSRLMVLEQRLEMLADSIALQQQSIDGQQAKLTLALSGFGDLPARIEQLEQQLSDIPGINARSKADWLEAEALYYLRIANAQLALVGNAEVAATALSLADAKLRDSGDPSVVAVRARISEELSALRELPAIDRAGISFELQALSTRVNAWPFRIEAPDSFNSDTVPPALDLGPWDRLVATLKSVFTSIVSVKSTSAPTIAHLGAIEKALIIESIKAELQVARLAINSNDTELYKTSLENVTRQINEYFELDSAAIKAAVATLSDLQDVTLSGKLPDISGSLTLLLKQSETAGTP